MILSLKKSSEAKAFKSDREGTFKKNVTVSRNNFDLYHATYLYV